MYRRALFMDVHFFTTVSAGMNFTWVSLMCDVMLYECNELVPEDRWGGHVARMRDRRGAYRFLVGKHEVRRPLGIPRRRWEHNIKMDFFRSAMWGTYIKNVGTFFYNFTFLYCTLYAFFVQYFVTFYDALVKEWDFVA